MSENNKNREWNRYSNGERKYPPLEINKKVKDIKLHKYHGSRYCVEHYIGSPYILIKELFSRGGSDYKEMDHQYRIFINEVEEHIKALRRCVKVVDMEKRRIEKIEGKTFDW